MNETFWQIWHSLLLEVGSLSDGGFQLDTLGV